MYQTIMFDLDGTLSDSFPGISGGILYALEKLGVEKPPLERLRYFVGPPLTHSFKAVFGFDDETVANGVKYYREYYSDKGILEQTLYDGIRELLQALKSDGKRICLATSKPQIYAERILVNLGINEYFDGIAGSTMDGKISEKSDVIALALTKTPSPPNECLMVGDRFYDVIGAHFHGIKCACVTHGFGTREEFLEYGADFILDSPADLLKITRQSR